MMPVAAQVEGFVPLAGRIHERRPFPGLALIGRVIGRCDMAGRFANHILSGKDDIPILRLDESAYRSGVASLDDLGVTPGLATIATPRGPDIELHIRDEVR